MREQKTDNKWIARGEYRALSTARMHRARHVYTSRSVERAPCRARSERFGSSGVDPASVILVL